MLKRIKEFVKRAKTMAEVTKLETELRSIGWKVIASDDFQLMWDWNRLMREIDELNADNYIELADGVWMVKF